MRKVNFNNLNNIEIPESWTQKALNLPNAPIKKKSVFALPSFYRRLSFVACCVLACALAVAIFGFTKNDILPQKTPAESTVNSTAYNTSSSETATQNSGITQKPTSVKPTQNIEPTEKPAENPTQSESDDSFSQTQEPTEMPTQKATQKPTQKETSYPATQPPKPTEPQKPSQPPTEPVEGDTEPMPTEPTPTEPEDTPDGPAYVGDGVCVGYIDESLLCGSTTVYCFVKINSEDSAGIETDPIQYPANVTVLGNGKVCVSFVGNTSVDVWCSDYYNFYFLNVNGDIIYQETVYVTKK